MGTAPVSKSIQDVISNLSITHKTSLLQRKLQSIQHVGQEAHLYSRILEDKDVCLNAYVKQV